MEAPVSAATSNTIRTSGGYISTQIQGMSAEGVTVRFVAETSLVLDQGTRCKQAGSPARRMSRQRWRMRFEPFTERFQLHTQDALADVAHRVNLLYGSNRRYLKWERGTKSIWTH